MKGREEAEQGVDKCAGKKEKGGTGAYGEWKGREGEGRR